MAKRPSARRTSDADDVDDDDGYAWESPKKKKDTGGLKKSATGRAKAKRPSADDEDDEPAPRAAGKSAAAKKSGKSTGSTKLSKSGSTRLEGSSRTKRGGSARRPSSSEGDEDEGSTSGRKRRAGPPRKKQDNTIILISIVSLTVLVIGGLVLKSQITTVPEARNDQSALEGVLSMGKEGEQAFNAWNRAKNGKGGDERTAYQEAHTKLQGAVEGLQKILSQPPYADEQGNTKAEYEGYDSYMEKWATLLVDLEKGSTLDSH